MTKFWSQLGRRAVLGSLILSALLLAYRPASAQVPSQLQPPSGNVEKLRLHGVGVQIYVSVASGSGFAWQFVAPSAMLYNDGGHAMISHFAGPTWQTVNGSSDSFVVGVKNIGITLDSASIPWLLLHAGSTGGHGMLSDVTFIQRLDTVGGLAPATPPTAAGNLVAIPYSATYVFFNSDQGRP